MGDGQEVPSHEVKAAESIDLWFHCGKVLLGTSEALKFHRRLKVESLELCRGSNLSRSSASHERSHTWFNSVKSRKLR